MSWLASVSVLVTACNLARTSMSAIADTVMLTIQAHDLGQDVRVPGVGLRPPTSNAGPDASPTVPG